MKKKGLRGRVVAAFTLVELITVVGIITILSAIVVPNTIEMMRNSRIEAADTLAYELYTATQNYLTDMQIKNKPLCYDSSNDTTKITAVFPVAKSSSTGAHKIIFGVNKDDTTGRFYYDNPGTGFTSFSSAVTDQDQKKKDIVNGIRRYLGSAIDTNSLGYFAAQIDADTYTVDWVLCSEQPDAAGDVAKVVVHYNSSRQLYQSHFDVDNNSKNGWTSQEYDSKHRSEGYPAFVGQYPIPYGK